MKTRSMALLVSIMLLWTMAASAAEQFTCKPGETVDVVFTVTANPEHAVTAVLTPVFDRAAFDFATSEIGSNGKRVLVEMNGIPVGQKVTIPFIAQSTAANGEYSFSLDVQEVVDFDEKSVTGLTFSDVAVLIGPSKKRPENQYFSNGELKTEYIFNNEDQVQRINHYNRYGEIKSYQLNEKFDKDGHAVENTYYSFANTGKYGEQNYKDTYSADGQLIRSKCTYADGTSGGTNEYEYDGQGRISKHSYYDGKGALSSIDTDYEYDSDNHSIAYQTLRPVTKQNSVTLETESRTENQWANNVRVYSKTVYTDGKVTETQYDPVYGDSIYQKTTDQTSTSTYTWTYNKSDYENEYVKLGDSYYHSITWYFTDGRQKESTSYDQDGNRDWSHVYSYDSQKRQTGSIATGYNEQGYVSYKFEYDEDHKTKKYTSYDEKGTIKYYDLYDYDSKGRRTKETEYSATGAVNSYTTYKYDNKDREIQRTEYSADNVVTSYTKSEYDSQDRIIKATRYYPNGNRQWITDYRYQSDGTRQSKTKHYKEDGSYWFGDEEWK